MQQATNHAPDDDRNVLGRRVFLAMIPANLLLLPWIWLGRGLFGSMGWFIVIMLYALPFIALALLLTTMLAFVRSEKPRQLTRPQAIAHLVMWGAMLGFGFFLVDFGDTEDSISSAFTQVVGGGDTLIGLSGILSALFGLVAVAAWLTALALLLHKPRPQPTEPSPAS